MLLPKIITMFLFALITSSGLAAEFAITMDDPNLYRTPLMTPAERDHKILHQLNDLQTKAALFVCGQKIDSEQGQQLLSRWDKQGHLIANHTYSHLYFNRDDTTLEAYKADILKVEPLIKGYDNFRALFRFPFLKSGDTKIKRDSIRRFLKSHGYSFGYVTVDASDWYISQRLEKRLAEDPNADIRDFKNFYLNHMWERAQYYDQLANKTIGRSPKHTILIHHNLLNALFLRDLVTHFQAKGWTLTDADTAFKDPIFKLEPQTLPSGEGIIWALAKESGDADLRYPAEDGTYEKEEMNRLGL